MDSSDRPIQHLLSLPPSMAGRFANLEERGCPEWYADCDPEGRPLGSGGGTAHLLAKAWGATGAGLRWDEWLGVSRKLMIHAGGQSRRLPAYGPTGKVLMPFPVFRWGRGQRLEQTLLDVQVADYRRVLRHAPEGFVAMLASGDVLLRFGAELPEFPEVDVLGLGMWTTPAEARHFGVFFTPRRQSGELAFFLQKPAPERIQAMAERHHYLIDTGMWLLSRRAVGVLMARCGWEGEGEVTAVTGRFRGGVPEAYEFYAEFALALGTSPTRRDPALAGLTSAVVALPEAEFYHFGTSRQMIESLSTLQNRHLEAGNPAPSTGGWHPNQFTQNAKLHQAVHREENHTLWVENSVIPETWKLAHEHVLTGIPENSWQLRLEPGVCLDFVPISESQWCVRAYGIDDVFSGPIRSRETTYLGRALESWLERRGLEVGDLLVAEGENDPDIQGAALFPVLEFPALDGAFLEWLVWSEPRNSDEHRRRWRDSRRLSARMLLSEANLERIYAQRGKLRFQALEAMLRHRRWSVFYRLDLERTAQTFVSGTSSGLPCDGEGDGEALDRVHDAMFRAAVLRRRGDADWSRAEARAFEILREVIVSETRLGPAAPRLAIVEDQIVWARSPVRFDLAGGWTDTPPYCLEHGGQVVNVAVDLNGQPPMQVFARLGARPEIVLRSIDLGVETRVKTYRDLESFGTTEGAFSLVKAACALAGFLPKFHAGGGASSLEDQLREFGGGLELSVLSAVPKGSGLGTSSILAATVLAALSEVCGLGWDREMLFERTLALEQMITTGGGWQDQAGGVFGGVKLVETSAGLHQVPRVRWFPDTLFGNDYANRRILLYYTGITRLAKGILAEIVRGIFLNSPEHLATLREIGASAYSTSLAIERRDYGALAGAIRNTWRLKQQLDRGTNPPEVQGILAAVGDDLLAAKLPGAGGGGFLLMLARDEDAALRIRRRLTERPPNRRARFVDFSVSESGLKVTRS